MGGSSSWGQCLVAVDGCVVCGTQREGVECHQRVIKTRWWCRGWNESPPTSHDDLWVVLGTSVVSGRKLKATNESLRLVGGVEDGMKVHPRVTTTRGWFFGPASTAVSCAGCSRRESRATNESLRLIGGVGDGMNHECPPTSRRDSWVVLGWFLGPASCVGRGGKAHPSACNKSQKKEKKREKKDTWGSRRRRVSIPSPRSTRGWFLVLLSSWFSTQYNGGI